MTNMIIIHSKQLFLNAITAQPYIQVETGWENGLEDLLPMWNDPVVGKPIVELAAPSKYYPDPITYGG